MPRSNPVFARHPCDRTGGASPYHRVRPAVNHALITGAAPLDKNKNGTYKNIQKTTEVLMLSFLKDALAFITIAGFSVASLGWMDIASRLV
jgi:hypothetical protein